MKKLVALSLTICSALSCFTGCNFSFSSSCEHTYEWVQYEEAHQKVYTCGCPTPDIAEIHLDADENYICDICEYEIKIPESKGLEFIKNNNGMNYAVKSIGSCADKDIIIPNEYEGLPVVGILPEAFMWNLKLQAVGNGHLNTDFSIVKT